MLRVQVEQIDLDFDLVSIEGLPLPFRIKQAKGSPTISTIGYLLETPAEAATAPRDYDKMTSALADSLGKTLGTFGTTKALESLELPESHLPEGCCFLDDGPKSCPVPAGALTMTNLADLDHAGASTVSNLAHRVDRQLQVDCAGALTMTNLAHRLIFRSNVQYRFRRAERECIAQILN